MRISILGLHMVGFKLILNIDNIIISCLRKELTFSYFLFLEYRFVIVILIKAKRLNHQNA
jgi:hypothetical protein